MRTPLRAGAAVALCACVAGCAVLRVSSVPSAAVTPVEASAIAPEQAGDALAIGKSTKADVIAALGKTMAISFDSGFELWVYQIKGDPPAKAAGAERARQKTEFVVLFNPSTHRASPSRLEFALRQCPPRPKGHSAAAGPDGRSRVAPGSRTLTLSQIRT